MATQSERNNLQNCWEFIDCPQETREKCEVYKKDLGNTCWFIFGHTERGCLAYDKYGGCFNCPWYKKQNSSWETH